MKLSNKDKSHLIKIERELRQRERSYKRWFVTYRDPENNNICMPSFLWKKDADKFIEKLQELDVPVLDLECEDYWL